MQVESMSIGSLAEATGCKVQTIRYYEQIGVMPRAERTAGNHRSYGRRHVERLAFIRHARELGFPLEAVKELLALSDIPNQSCSAVDRVVRDQLLRVNNRIKRLESLQREFQRMLRHCKHGKVSECRVIEVLADHSHAKCFDPKHAGDDDRDTRNHRS